MKSKLPTINTLEKLCYFIYTFETQIRMMTSLAPSSVSKIPLITAEFNLAFSLSPLPSPLPPPFLLSMTVIRAYTTLSLCRVPFVVSLYFCRSRSHAQATRKRVSSTKTSGKVGYTLHIRGI